MHNKMIVKDVWIVNCELILLFVFLWLHVYLQSIRRMFEDTSALELQIAHMKLQS